MIIHSPVISGSLTFAEGATFTMPDNGVYSGSFSGSFQGDGSSLTFGGTNIFSSSAQLSTDFLDTLGDGVVSSSVQIDVEQTTNFNAFSSSIANTFAGLSSDFDDLVDNPFTQSATQITVSKSIIPSNGDLTLGTSENPFKDLFLSSASLYIDGTQVLSSDSTELIISTDANQSLRLVESGADTITLQTNDGDITITTTGTGNIELDAPIQIGAGNQILSSDGNAIQFGEDINVQGNITVTGTVDGVDIAQLNTNLGDLDSKTLVSGSSQIVLEDADKTGFTGASSITTLGTVTSGNVTAILPDGVISGSSQVSLSTTNVSEGSNLYYTDARVKAKLTEENVISGSDQVSITLSQVSDVTATATEVNVLDGITASTTELNFVDGVTSAIQTQLDGKQAAGSYVTTTSDQALKGTTALSLVGNNLTLTKGDDSTDTIDLSAYLDEDSRSIASGVLDGASGIVTFTRDDATTFTLDLSDLLDDTNLVTSVNGEAGVVVLTTSDIDEGTNKYYTDARARAAISVSGDLSYESSTGVISFTETANYSDADVDAHLSGGTGVSYNAGTISIGQAVGTADTVRFSKIGVGTNADSTYELKVSGDIGATGDVVAYVSSDERLKKNIELISNPIQKVQALKGVTWVWKDEASDAAKQSPNVGVIAQDVEKVLPQLVHDRENGYKGVDYGKMVGLLIEAIKDQQKQIDDLKSRLQ